MARQFYVRQEGLTSFKELCGLNPITVDYANGKEVWDSEFSGDKWSRYMDYWNVDRAVVQTCPPGFDGLVAYRLDESKTDLQQQASAKDEFKKRIRQVRDALNKIKDRDRLEQIAAILGV